MAIDYKGVVTEFKNAIEGLGLQREEIEKLVKGSAPDAKKTKKALDAVDALGKALEALVDSTQLPESELKRRVAELEVQIEVATLLREQEDDEEKRRELRQRIAVLSGRLMVLGSLDAFRVGDLMDEDGQKLKSLIEDANRDIQARHDFARVLKGVEIALRVAAFGAAAVAKVAAAA